jgi:hypothetical protein
MSNVTMKLYSTSMKAVYRGKNWTVVFESFTCAYGFIECINIGKESNRRYMG